MKLLRRQHDKAIAEAEKALALDPNGALTYSNLGYSLHLAGRDEEAIPFLERAIRLNPYPPSFYYDWLGAAYTVLERYDEAIDACKKALKRQPNDFLVHLYLTGIYCAQDRLEDARAYASEALRINPQYSISILTSTWLNKNKEALKHVAECFRKAGIPE